MTDPLQAPRELKRFYQAYRDSIESFKKSPVKSALLATLEMKANARAIVQRSGSLSAADVDIDVLAALETHRWIQETDERSKYVITASGLWAAERGEGVLDEHSLIDFIDRKFFNSLARPESLSGKEKVIVFAMLSARAFSRESEVNLGAADSSINDHWRGILQSSLDFLAELGIFRAEGTPQLFRDRGNEHPVSNLIRHTDALPKKIKGLFVARGKQHYFLDVYGRGSLDPGALSFLFGKVFDGNFSVETGEQVYDFCRKIAYGEAAYVYDSERHLFSSPRYDDILRRAIFDVVVASSQIVE